MSLAVNVVDLTRLPEAIRPMLLGGRISRTSEIVRTDPHRADEAAVVFDCDLLTAAATADVIRGHDRRSGDYPTRVYLRRAVAWAKLPAGAVLIVIEDGRAALNPAVFGAEAVDLEAEPVDRRRVEV